MSIYQSMPLEEFDGSVGNRFSRDYEEMATTDTAGVPDARKGRQLDEQSIERQGRLYVDPETLISATGKDAKLEVDEYGLTIVGEDRYKRPAGAVTTNKEAIDKDLVPDVGQHIKGWTPPVVEEEEEEEVTDPGTEEPGTG